MGSRLKRLAIESKLFDLQKIEMQDGELIKVLEHGRKGGIHTLWVPKEVVGWLKIKPSVGKVGKNTRSGVPMVHEFSEIEDDLPIAEPEDRLFMVVKAGVMEPSPVFLNDKEPNQMGLVETVEGLRDLQIPSGIQPGDTIKLSYMGIPNIKKPSVRGDHCFIVNVQIPKDISFPDLLKAWFETRSSSSSLAIPVFTLVSCTLKKIHAFIGLTFSMVSSEDQTPNNLDCHVPCSRSSLQSESSLVYDAEHVLVEKLASLRASCKDFSIQSNGTLEGELENHEMRNQRNHASSKGSRQVASLWSSIKNFLGFIRASCYNYGTVHIFPLKQQKNGVKAFCEDNNTNQETEDPVLGFSKPIERTVEMHIRILIPEWRNIGTDINGE
ncbi:hypothetical protein HHK36_014817 [Tetracentron sinense]|uniref:Chaperone DnaJ C-terminal domain-containing protein n=1 Tax=Tetracentron sinense TaxID=13715 RepID=A0A834Z3G7_TETSI|nr:hypothetical protein HHK36_014817 [Tetracentron sinense]